MQFKQTQLANGLQVLAELNPAVQSVALGIFVKAGSRDETSAVSGVSHFLEHMMFKGTSRHSGLDVNRYFDELGANYNAMTGEEYTQYYAVVLPENFPALFELFADLMQPALREADFLTEKGAVLEEISKYEDQPQDVAYVQVLQDYFGLHPLGNSILGTTSSVQNLTIYQMREYFQQRYLAGNITVVVTGATDWEQVLELAHKYCAHWTAGQTVRTQQAVQPKSQTRWIVRPDQQMEQLVFLTPAPAAIDRLRYAAEILAMIVGDDGNSRLYWKLVDPGLCEFAGLSYFDYQDAGVFLSYLSCDPDMVNSNLALMQAVYQEVHELGITPQELEQAKNKVATQLVLQSERPSGRMNDIGTNWLYRQEYLSLQQQLKLLEAVSLDDLQTLLQQYQLTPVNTLGVGPFKEDASG